MLYGSVVDHRCRGQRVIELFTLKNKFKKIIIMLLLGEISLYVLGGWKAAGNGFIMLLLLLFMIW